MRVTLQLPPPGVQNANESTTTRPQVALVLCQGFDGFGGGGEERALGKVKKLAKRAQIRLLRAFAEALSCRASWVTQ